MAQMLPNALLRQMARCVSEAPESLRPLWTAMASVFLKREESQWEMMTERPLVMEQRFQRFLECPSSYEMLIEMLNEEGEGGAPANNAGGGAIAGLGVPAAPGMSKNPNFAEPGVDVRKRKKKPTMLTRGVAESVEPSDTFAGADVFEVDMDRLIGVQTVKHPRHRYSKYVGEDETGEAIRQHGRTHTNGIILRDANTKVMRYLKYGKNGK